MLWKCQMNVVKKERILWENININASETKMSCEKNQNVSEKNARKCQRSVFEIREIVNEMRLK